MNSPVNTISESSRTDTLAIVSLGSNLGAEGSSSRAVLADALRHLQRLSKQPLQVSALYQTSPLDSPPGAPDFMNAVALLYVAPVISAAAFLQQLHEIEYKFGRSRGAERNQPRTLDLDLIAFGVERGAGPELILPHPRAHLRRFVMAPLAELAPDLKLPGQELTAAELAQRLESTTAAEQQVRLVRWDRDVTH